MIDNKYFASKSLDFERLLRESSFDNIGLDPYNFKYIQHYLSKVKYNLYIVSDILQKAGDLNQYKRIIDLGGGIGFNTAFIKSLNLEAEIIYLDVDEVSAKDAQLFHKNIGLVADKYLLGDLADHQNIVDESTLICSRDVIEHIYDLASFFKISAKAKYNVHNTAAVKNHIFRKNEFRSIHNRAENTGNKSEILKARDGSEAYLETRKTIIRTLDPSLDEHQVTLKAAATKGLIKKDIERYLLSDKYPEYHIRCLGTNTCDPFTGNWAERLLSKDEYQLYADPIRLKFTYLKYNSVENSIFKKGLLACLNIFAKLPIHQVQASFNIVY